MGGVQKQLVIKFRLHDGSDIGPKTYLAATTVATLKEGILAEWPKGKDIAPKTINDVKLINGGRILENNKILGECKSPICNLTGGVTTMHIIIRPPAAEKRTTKKAASAPKEARLRCVIL